MGEREEVARSEVLSESARKLLGTFYKTVDVMKSARNSPSVTMSVWADDMKAMEDVMFFLEQLRDSASVAQAVPEPDLLTKYRDIFAEITAKAVPVCDPTGDDPERVRHYIVPVGPIHRAAGKLNFQMFNGEAYLASAIKNLSLARDAAIEECAQVCEGGEWTRHATNHSPTKSCAIAIRALKASPVPSAHRGGDK